MVFYVFVVSVWFMPSSFVCAMVLHVYMYESHQSQFFLKNNCLERVVLCCFVFLLCCVALSFFLSKHLMDN